MAAGEELGEGRVREFGMGMYTVLYLKWITNKDLLYSAGNSTQCYVAAWMGRDFGREWIQRLLWMWGRPSCLFSSGEGYVGELLELQQGCEGPYVSSKG